MMSCRRIGRLRYPCFFFFNDSATTEIYPLSLHDALPIFVHHHRLLVRELEVGVAVGDVDPRLGQRLARLLVLRSEEHTSELQSRLHLVCRLLLEKKKQSTAGPNAMCAHTRTRPLS